MGARTRTKRHQEQRRIFSAQLLSVPSCSPSPSSLPFVLLVVVDSTEKVNITPSYVLRLAFSL